jgi:hypothetical protein
VIYFRSHALYNLQLKKEQMKRTEGSGDGEDAKTPGNKVVFNFGSSAAEKKAAAAERIGIASRRH